MQSSKPGNEQEQARDELHSPTRMQEDAKKENRVMTDEEAQKKSY